MTAANDTKHNDEGRTDKIAISTEFIRRALLFSMVKRSILIYKEVLWVCVKSGLVQFAELEGAEDAQAASLFFQDE